MTRFLFGPAPADYVVTAGTGNVATLAANATLTAWNSENGGTRYTDLTADAAGLAPVGSWITDATGRPAEVYGPDEIQEMWVSANGGTRVLMGAADAASTLAARIAKVTGAAGQPGGYATLDGSGLVPTSQLPGGMGGTVALSDLSDVDATGATDGAVPVYSAADHDYVVGSALEATIKSPDLTVGVLTEPMWKIIQDHVPDASEPNTIEFWSTYNGTPKLVGWINERGLFRGEQIPGGTGWENPFKAIVNVAGTGAAYAIDRRNADNSRTAIGGIDVNGRMITSLQEWTEVTDYDPGATGWYSASTQDTGGSFGPYTFDTLACRMDSDDEVRMRGVVAIAAPASGTNLNTGDVLFKVPSGFEPSTTRAINVGFRGGKCFPCMVLADGSVLVRASQSNSGASTIYLDGVVYLR